MWLALGRVATNVACCSLSVPGCDSSRGVLVLAWPCFGGKKKRIDLPRYFLLIYVAFFKSGPLGTLLGPTLAEDRPKTQKHWELYNQFV